LQKKRGVHMDILSDSEGIPTRTVLLRAGVFFGWLLAFMASMALIGLLPTMFIFVIAYMRIEGRERWPVVLGMAAGVTLFAYALFAQLLSLPWPPTVAGDFFPQLATIVPSMWSHHELPAVCK